MSLLSQDIRRVSRAQSHAAAEVADESTHRGQRREALIIDILLAIFDILREAHTNAHTRELRAQARSLENAVKHWTAVPPSAPQVAAMFEIVTELHAKTVSSAINR